MYTRGGKSTVEKPPLVNKPKIYKGRLGEVWEARGGKSTKPKCIKKVSIYTFNSVQCFEYVNNEWQLSIVLDSFHSLGLFVNLVRIFTKDLPISAVWLQFGQNPEGKTCLH